METLILGIIIGLLIGTFVGWQLHFKTMKEMFLNGDLLYRDSHAEMKWMIENKILMAHRKKTGITIYYTEDGKEILETVWQILLKGD